MDKRNICFYFFNRVRKNLNLHKCVLYGTLATL